jgi:hypothetical protein
MATRTTPELAPPGESHAHMSVSSLGPAFPSILRSQPPHLFQEPEPSVPLVVLGSLPDFEHSESAFRPDDAAENEEKEKGKMP